MLVVFSALLPSTFSAVAGFSSDGVGGASLRGGMRSLIASSPLASANDAILWFGENPCNAANVVENLRFATIGNVLNNLPFLSDALPPDNAPKGKAPVGVNPFNCNTDSDSSLWIRKN